MPGEKRGEENVTAAVHGRDAADPSDALKSVLSRSFAF